jgi:predicted RNA binding protein YcfA (HicA-like mRNA interferase family)
MSDQKIIPIHYTTLVRIFELEGFQIKRRKGDHIIMVKPGVKRPVVIKSSPRFVPITHIRSNMLTAGMSRERYFELLKIVK